MDQVAIKFSDGCGYLHDSVADIWINCELVRVGIRPAFMIQKCDYSDEDRDRVMAFINNYLVTHYPSYIGYMTNQGILIVHPQEWGWVKWAVRSYEEKVVLQNFRESDYILGLILGYPCYGENCYDYHDPSRIGCDIHTYSMKPHDTGERGIVANVCFTKTKHKFDQFAEMVMRFCDEKMGIYTEYSWRPLFISRPNR